ncbi:DUF4112 domain-containing protein [Acinetobacter gerneri]|uniref:DUF4112 domain-containing protein n=1 Tax=Acinetobacter gerneri TaxID=202952 RepID=A0AAW8JIW2_9GAMM|nr:DUF4112 domain-containing protein [Acinetobacter gerneri]MDQ9010528.1 DUF4112 domain-containing protein [Acinetobacter gerneri]MDQ9014727.1 DUF4112 domain-containing protein [Acinetobacter gerneri]MDQ9025935.1 DUF4112 domain-containing protein [Acinetobacter gerneri]MDQ9053179.1 DUF4112 domain-containing protein [Acinetobacter gerneri]MDQ9060834.1 DUF4112 domain-containing protein [Acinetobacter gerneri]
MSQEKKLTKNEVIRLERDLAKYANMMDSVVRIPFTKQGMGADAALSTIPIAGDVAGFVLTCYAVYKAKQIGVPQAKLNGVLKLAVIDGVVGCIPVLGTVFDIFIRPSRKALDVVHEHIREEYQIHSESHVMHPFLHESLEKKQQSSAFWRNPVIAWFWLHIPDLLGAILLVLIGIALWFGFTTLWHWFQQFEMSR